MKFYPDKCAFNRDSISFCGVTLSADGMKPNPRKIDATKNLPEPRTEALLQLFLGTVNLSVQIYPKHSQDDLCHWDGTPSICTKRT